MSQFPTGKERPKTAKRKLRTRTGASVKPNWVKLEDLRPGAIFETEKGARAVKTVERHISVVHGEGQYKCVLLHTGQHGHFPEGNETLVREIVLFGG
jgi:hypothetical protein